MLPETLFICRSLTVIGSYFCLLFDFLVPFSGTSPPPLNVQPYQCDLLLFTLRAHARIVHSTGLECRVILSLLPRPSPLPGGFLPLLGGCSLGSSGLSDTPSNVASSSSSLSISFHTLTFLATAASQNHEITDGRVRTLVL